MRRVQMIALALLAVSCGSPASGPTPSSSSVMVDASRVDVCTILTDTELTGLGFNANARQTFNKVGVIGCGWQNKSITLGLYRDKETLASYRARRQSPTFTSFVDNTVNGRAGAHLSVDRDRGDCTQLIDGGPVSLSVAVAPSGFYKGPKIDSCAEALRIAQMIEPRLPKAGS